MKLKKLLSLALALSMALSLAGLRQWRQRDRQHPRFQRLRQRRLHLSVRRRGEGSHPRGTL